MRFLFFFIDGVGLGPDDPETNPLARAEMPVLQSLLGGQRLLQSAAPFDGSQASLLALDANLGVERLPQSASGQATLLTGLNVPQRLGYHYGPKPNPPIADLLRSGTLFHDFSANGHSQNGGRSAVFLNAYPPRYFDGIESGRRLFSAIPLAAVNAGLALRTDRDLKAGRALSADFTAQGWHEHLGLTDVPRLTPHAAGRRLAELAAQSDFSFFEYWLSDYAGHRQDMPAAIDLLQNFDQVLGGLLEAWDPEAGLALITSDHGNLEDLSTRRHTRNPVPALLIGSAALRQAFSAGLHDLTDVAPAVRRLFSPS